MFVVVHVGKKFTRITPFLSQKAIFVTSDCALSHLFFLQYVSWCCLVKTAITWPLLMAGVAENLLFRDIHLVSELFMWHMSSGINAVQGCPLSGFSWSCTFSLFVFCNQWYQLLNGIRMHSSFTVPFAWMCTNTSGLAPSEQGFRSLFIALHC